jgi:hypothetical protein
MLYIVSDKKDSSRLTAHGSSFVNVCRQKTNIKQGKSFFVITNQVNCVALVDSFLHGTGISVCGTSAFGSPSTKLRTDVLSWLIAY